MSRKIKFKIPERDESSSEDPATIPMRPNRTSGSLWGGATGMRLGLLVLMLVLVILAMNHASKPESWNWLFKFDKVELPADESAGQGNAFVDPGPNDSAANTETAETDSSPDKSVNESETLHDAALPTSPAANEEEFWRLALRQLSGPEQVRLFNLVEAASRQSGLPPGSTAAHQPLIIQLSRLRSRNAKRLADSGDSRIETGDSVMFLDVWRESLHPAMLSVIEDRPDQELIDDQVRAMVPTLRSVSRSTIRDKTPVGRDQEAYAWFDAWSEVFDQPIEQLDGQSATVTQLLSQPAAWRGQTLEVSGTAMRVQRVDATHNALGIDRYYVIWIKPDHPSIYPWCVYTLIAPEALTGEPHETMRVVEQPVKTTGRFFKNRLFPAGTGEAAYAPVVLTAAVEIPQTAAPSADRKFRLPGRNTMLVVLGLIIGLAALIAVTVYRSTLSGRVKALPKPDRLQQEFKKLEQDDRVETTEEKLQKLGRHQAAADETPDTDGDA